MMKKPGTVVTQGVHSDGMYTCTVCDRLIKGGAVSKTIYLVPDGISQKYYHFSCYTGVAGRGDACIS